MYGNPDPARANPLTNRYIPLTPMEITAANMLTITAQHTANIEITTASTAIAIGTHTGDPTTARTIAAGVQPFFGFTFVLTSVARGVS